MKIKAILFDLDGTLLPMDQDTFVKAYFGLLAKKLAPYGYDPKALIGAIWQGTDAMIANTGERTNEEVFWDAFCRVLGEKARESEPILEEFYKVEFDGARAACGYNPEAARTIAVLKEKGFRLALATNPIFPAVATEARMSWVDLSPSDFELYTTYENSRYCKPKAEYYLAIAEQMCVSPEECLMVGNDVSDDLPAEQTGMKVFILSDCLINKEGKYISSYPQGSFAELIKFVEKECV